MFWFFAAAGTLLGNALLQVLDVWTTVQALEAGAMERNEVSRTIMDSMGIGAWVALKAGIIAVLLLCTLLLRNTNLDRLKRLTMPAAALFIWMGGVIVNNLRVMGLI